MPQNFKCPGCGADLQLVENEVMQLVLATPVVAHEVPTPTVAPEVPAEPTSDPVPETPAQ